MYTYNNIPFGSFNGNVSLVYVSSCLVNLSIDHVETRLNCFDFISSNVHDLLVQTSTTETTNKLHHSRTSWMRWQQAASQKRSDLD